jgi:hypothetical protein
LAVRTEQSEDVVRALGLRTVLPANWRAGLKDVAERGVFVTAPVDGWVFAVGPDLRVLGEPESVVPPLLERLSRDFGRTAWFLSDAVADLHGWALAANGALVRGYAYDGDRGHVFWHGDVTVEERRLGCFVDDPRDRSDDEVKWWPDERIVLEIASAWSLDPRGLGERSLPRSAGWVGRL